MVRCKCSMAGLVVFCLGLGSAGGRADEAGKEAAWLREHVVPVRTIDPQDEDFTDLLPLAEKIGAARVVALGEQSHGDGATFLAKHRLVRFLHQQMGFDVLAWESGLFDCRVMDRALQAGEAVPDAAAKGIFPIWGASQHVVPVLAYAAASARTGRRLEMAGFDCQFSSRGAAGRYLQAVEDFVDRANPSLLSAVERQRLAWLVNRLEEREPGGTAAEVRDARQVVQDLTARLDAEGASLARVHSQREVRFVKRTLANLLTYDDVRRQPGTEDANLRDRAMGENLAWLAREFYPDRKIIVWAASFHLLRNAPAVQWLGGGGSYAKTVPMGHVAHQRLGADYYSVMFTASAGQAGNPFRKPSDLPPPPRGSLEDLLEQTGRAYAFLDLRSLPEGGQWLTGELVARPLGYGLMKANWTQAFDAVFYTKTMFPSTQDGRVPAGVLTARPATKAHPVARALEEYRQTLIGYDLGFDSVFPRRPWTGYDAKRLAKYPTAEAWPDVLGHVDKDPASFKRVPAGAPAPKAESGALAFAGPLREPLTLDGYATVVGLDGIAADGVVTAKSYASVICHGTMAGKLFFGSYGTAFVKGDLTGQVTAKSYFNLVVTGKFSGHLYTDSYAMIYLLGGFRGDIELGPSRLYLAGRTMKADLARVKSTGRGGGTVYLEESDLPAGTHKVGDLDVTVAKSVPAP